MTKVNTFKVEALPDFPAGENPFCHDAVNMGTEVGTNVVVMFAATSTEQCRYLIIVNTKTGKRLKVHVEG